MNLPEVLIGMAIFSLIVVVLALLFRSAGNEYGQSTADIYVTQTARRVLDSVTPYASSAVPARPGQMDFIYSPQEGADPTKPYPNLYSLDFCSAVDFLGNQVTPNRRGTGPKTRYRIRFVPADEQLILEKLQADSVAPVPDPNTPSRILGRGLKRVTFEKHGASITMRVTATAVDREGKLRAGLQSQRGKDQDPDVDAPGNRAATTAEVFSTVLLPISTVR